jgi:hypothetical protein
MEGNKVKLNKREIYERCRPRELSDEKWKILLKLWHKSKLKRQNTRKG